MATRYVALVPLWSKSAEKHIKPGETVDVSRYTADDLRICQELGMIAPAPADEVTTEE